MSENPQEDAVVETDEREPHEEIASSETKELEVLTDERDEEREWPKKDAAGLTAGGTTREPKETVGNASATGDFQAGSRISAARSEKSASSSAASSSMRRCASVLEGCGAMGCGVRKPRPRFA